MEGQGSDSKIAYGEEVLDGLYPMLTKFLATCSDQARPGVVSRLNRFLDEQIALSLQENRHGCHLPPAVLDNDQAESSSTTPDLKPEAQTHGRASDMSADLESQDFDVVEAITRIRDLARAYLQKVSGNPSDGTQESEEKEDDDRNDSPQHADKPERYIDDQIAWYIKAFYPTHKQQVLQTKVTHDNSASEVIEPHPIPVDPTCNHCGKIKQAETDQCKSGNWLKYCKTCTDSGLNKSKYSIENSFATCEERLRTLLLPHASRLPSDETESAKKNQALLRQAFPDPPHEVSSDLMNTPDFKVLLRTAGLHKTLEKGTRPKSHWEKAEYRLNLVNFYAFYSGMIKACEDDHGEIRKFLKAIGSREEGWSRVVRDCISCLAKTFTTHIPSKKAPKSTTKEHTIYSAVKDAPSPQPSVYDSNGIEHAEKANGQPASPQQTKSRPYQGYCRRPEPQCC